MIPSDTRKKHLPRQPRGVPLTALIAPIAHMASALRLTPGAMGAGRVNLRGALIGRSTWATAPGAAPC